MLKGNLRTLLVATVLLVLPILDPFSAYAGPASLSQDGFWKGALSYRGADMPVRLEWQANEKTPRAWIDLPRLIMNREPVPVVKDASTVSIEFPFGIGVFELDTKDGVIESSRELGEHTMSLRLEQGPPPPYSRRPVNFMADGVTLSGEILLPHAPGPHPGVVLLHGSGRIGKDNWSYRSWADLLAREGMAVLYYDKRGIGESGGHYESSLAQMSGDAIAAMRALRKYPEVDAQRTGFKGFSQSAWLALRAAATLQDVHFLILVSAAAVTPRQQELQQIEYGMRDDGIDENDIEAALNYMGLYFYVARTGRGWPLLEQAIKEAQASSWGQYVDQPLNLEHLGWWKENHDLQPASYAGKLDIPVLLLYGAADWMTPAIANAEPLRRLFPNPGKVETHVLPGGDHRLELGWITDPEKPWQWAQIAPQVFEILPEWLGRELN